MVELTFRTRLKNFVPLSILRSIAASDTIEHVARLGLDENGDVSGLVYLTQKDLAELKAMPLLNRGRLSVQPVNAGAWAVINMLGENGGWNVGSTSKSSGSSKASKKASTEAEPANKGRKRKTPSENEDQRLSQKDQAAESNEDTLGRQPRRSKRLRT